FRAGYLHLAQQPPPALLAAPNPFDPRYRPIWLWDASLYHGHYYMYWGPFPALLLAGVKIVLRLRRSFGDHYAMFAFTMLQLVAAVLLLERMARRLFGGLTTFLVAVAVLVFAFANPIPFLLGRSAVYEAAIVGGQAFLLLGMVFAFDAVWAGGGAD